MNAICIIGLAPSRRHARNATALAILFSTLFFIQAASAIEVTEPEGASHGYPAWSDINGKKVADGEFRQWLENDRLHIVITYKFRDGRLFEEKALFRQEPELMQEQWSWKETR